MTYDAIVIGSGAGGATLAAFSRRYGDTLESQAVGAQAWSVAEAIRAWHDASPSTSAK